jgi:hypothetical protein
MQSVNKRRLFVLIGGVLLIVIILLVLLVHPKKTQTPKTTTYTDPYSHETVTDVAGKAPDTYGSNPATPIYLGFDKLLDHGMTFDQEGNLKTAFDNFSKTRPKPISQVSIDVDNITAQRDNSSFFLFFNVMVDRSDVFKAKVDYTGLSTIRLYLSDSKGNLVYDSQPVNTQAAE